MSNADVPPPAKKAKGGGLGFVAAPPPLVITESQRDKDKYAMILGAALNLMTSLTTPRRETT